MKFFNKINLLYLELYIFGKGCQKYIIPNIRTWLIRLKSFIKNVYKSQITKDFIKVLSTMFIMLWVHTSTLQYSIRISSLRFTLCVHQCKNGCLVITELGPNSDTKMSILRRMSKDGIAAKLYPASQ